MTAAPSFKARVRARMQATGERVSEARRALRIEVGFSASPEAEPGRVYRCCESEEDRGLRVGS